MCTHQYTAVLGRAQPESREALLAGFPLCSADFLFLPSGHMFAASIHNIISVSTHNLTLASIACESINFPGKCLLHSNLVTQNAFSLHYYTYTMNQYVEFANTLICEYVRGFSKLWCLAIQTVQHIPIHTIMMFKRAARKASICCPATAMRQNMHSE